MKILFITITLLSTFTFANTDTEKSPETLWPRITVWPNGVDLKIQNYTQDDYSCSGNIYITHQSGRRGTEYYYGRVYARMYETRYFSNRQYNDPIRNAQHTIRCYKL